MPICIEKKLLLSGETQIYPCDLVRLDNGFGILRYVVDRVYTVAGIRLAPGDVTYAFYWTDRPYTLYTWNPDANGTIVYYFNIADSIVHSRNEFSWRDLVLDILVDGSGEKHVLDEDEIPPSLEPGLREYIDASKMTVLSNGDDILNEVAPLVRSMHVG